MGEQKGTLQKKPPMRQCMGCGERREKRELLCIKRTPEGEIIIDFTGKKNGRSAYICNSTKCLALAQKKRSLERSLEVLVPETVYQELKKEMSGREQE